LLGFAVVAPAAELPVWVGALYKRIPDLPATA